MCGTELENILDEEDVDEADRVFLHDRLREQDDLDEKRERLLWSQIEQRGGAFLTSGPVSKIIQELITAKPDTADSCWSGPATSCT
jgi:hypothetical protein